MCTHSFCRICEYFLFYPQFFVFVKTFFFFTFTICFSRTLLTKPSTNTLSERMRVCVGLEFCFTFFQEKVIVEKPILVYVSYTVKKLSFLRSFCLETKRTPHVMYCLEQVQAALVAKIQEEKNSHSLRQFFFSWFWSMSVVEIFCSKKINHILGL
jgi:hypothetical protein